MHFKPHNLYKVEYLSTEKDEDGDPIPGTGGETLIHLCNCFLHDLKTEVKLGLAGKGIEANHSVNMDRRNDLVVGNVVVIKEVTEDNGEHEEIIRGHGKIVDIKNVSVLNYTKILI